ncbi:ABC transporter permease [Mycoplasmatota bacterium]|nr:ABC transporter permease [Mycoplasmatota bacterium]
MIITPYKTFKKDIILYLLITILILISTTFFVSLRVTSSSLKHNYDTFSVEQHKNQFVIVPDHNKLDQLIDSVSFFEFETYQNVYGNTPYALNYDNINNIGNNQYLTENEATFIQENINDEFIQRIKSSSKPSLVIYYPIKQIIFDQLDISLSDYYKNRIAETQAKYYTKLLFLLTLNETNYLKFVEYTLDNRLLEKNEHNEYLKSTYAYRFDLTIEKKVVKKLTSFINNKEVNYFLTTKQKSFNRPYVIKSLNHEIELSLNDHEIAIYQEFALNNNLKLGDNLLINDETYMIRAFIYTPDTIYPILSRNQFYYAFDRDTLVLMNEENFKSLSSTSFQSIVYTAKFNKNDKVDQALAELKSEFQNENILLIPQYSYSDQIIQTNLSNLNLLSYVLSFSILFIAVLFMSNLLVRKINQEQKQIGLLKALGYHNKEIMYPYLIQYLLLTIFAATLGFILGLFISKLLSNYFYTIFLLPYKQFHIDVFTIIGLLIQILIIMFVTYLILHMKLKKKTIVLLNQTDMIYQKKSNYSLKTKLIPFILILTTIFTLLIYLLTQRKELIYILCFDLMLYFSYYLFFRKPNFLRNIAKKISTRNFKKIISFNLTIFMTSLLLLFIFYSKRIYQDLHQIVKENYTYLTYIEYPNFLNLSKEDLNDCQEFNCEGIAAYRFKILEVPDEIYFGGYEENSKTMLKFVKTDLLKDHNVIISKPLADKYKLSVNDTLSVITHIISESSDNTAPCPFDSEETCIVETVNIVHITNNFTNMVVYGNLKLFNNWYYGDNDHETHINTVYTDSYLNFSSDSIFSRNILITYDINDIFGQLNHLFYTIVLITNFSFILISIISIIIMLLIMELTIKENVQQIALLKAYGYQNKEIRSMLLSPYSPYLFIMFFFTVPIGYFASHQLFYHIGLMMNKSLIVNIQYLDLFLSLSMLFIIYITTSYLSLLRIKHIGLASWLKKS